MQNKQSISNVIGVYFIHRQKHRESEGDEKGKG